MEDKEWSDWDQHKSFYRGLTILPWIVWVAIILAAIFATKAFSMPIYEAIEDGAKITLTDEDCTLKEVTNLKKRAIWQEKGKTYQGCYGVHPDGVILAYFDDGSVVVISMHYFHAVRGA